MMKKTIVSAALALGLAASASAVSLTDAVLSVPEYNGTPTSYTGTFSTINTDTTKERALTTLTLVFDWNTLQGLNLTSDTSAVALTKGTALSTSIGFDVNNGNLVAQTMSGTSGRSQGSALSNYVQVADGMEKLVLSITTNSGETGTILYYLNGDSQVHWTDSGLKWDCNTAGFDTLTINSAVASAIDSIYVFDSALSATDVVTVSKAALAAAVPEPTTATLSLLALAGLAARRRRK